MNLLLTAASVLLTVLAYPPFGIWPAGLLMLAPLVVAIERSSPRRACLLAYAYYAGMGLGIVRWLVHAMAVEYGTPLLGAWGVTLLVVASYSLVPAAACLGYRWLRVGFPAAWAAPLFAACWTLAEWIRGSPGGLPWVLAGHALAPVPVALQTADLGGVYAVGFLVSLTGAGLGIAFVQRRPQPLLAPGVMLLAALGYGAIRLDRLPSVPPQLRVGIVQASVPQGDRFRGAAERNARLHAELTRRLVAQERLDLVVWSETAIDTDLDAAPALRAALADLVTETGTPLVSGAPRSRDARRTNSVVLFAPGAGLVGSYDKQRLVPFSEYDPPLLSWLAPLLGPVAEGEPYVPGSRASVLEGLPLRIATPICFEITYPGAMREFRAAGAELLVNVSNDAWFGRTGYAELHFLQAVFRAVELRVWVVRAANTGVSGVVDPAGRVLETLPAFARGTLVAEVGAPERPGLYARAGDVPFVALLVASVLLALVLRVARR